MKRPKTTKPKSHDSTTTRSALNESADVSATTTLSATGNQAQSIQLKENNGKYSKVNTPENANTSGCTQILTLLVLFLTLLAITWYTFETNRLRVATQEQIKRSYLPLVVLEFKSRTFYTTDGEYDLQPTIRNVGFGPAFNIEVSSIENHGRRVDFDPVPGIGRDAEFELLPFALRDERGRESITELGRILTAVPEGRDLVLNALPVTISYVDGRGEKQQIVQEIQVRLDKREIVTVVKSVPSAEKAWVDRLW